MGGAHAAFRGEEEDMREDPFPTKGYGPGDGEGRKRPGGESGPPGWADSARKRWARGEKVAGLQGGRER
jgi:hypothetical protein